jgi:E3 ubiquitin-protein ligase HUWE1
MEANTEYQGYHKEDQTIRWFWKAVQTFSQEERAKLVQFITGTSKVLLYLLLSSIFFFIGSSRWI